MTNPKNSTHNLPALNTAPIVLGSISPRRHKLLDRLEVPFETVAVDINEICDHSDPVNTVVTNALTKHIGCRALRPEACIITADTMVWFEGRLIGKPRDLNEATAFLRAFSGRTQLVFSGVALSLPGQPIATRVISSSVLFHELSDTTINAYLERTKPLDRAGAYDIDENGDLLIASYSGSYTNIMGLPLEVVTDWLCANNLITND